MYPNNVLYNNLSDYGDAVFELTYLLCLFKTRVDNTP